MIKCKVYIYSGNSFLDSKVFVEMELPAVPYVGSFLVLGDLKNELELKAKTSVEIAQTYYPKWFKRMPKTKDKIVQGDIENLSFGDAMYVSSVTFMANDEFLYIEITDSDITGTIDLEK